MGSPICTRGNTLLDMSGIGAIGVKRQRGDGSGAVALRTQVIDAVSRVQEYVVRRGV